MNYADIAIKKSFNYDNLILLIASEAILFSNLQESETPCCSFFMPQKYVIMRLIITVGFANS